MHERERAAGELDQLAAEMNLLATRASGLVDERQRSADSLKAIARYELTDNADPQRAEWGASATRELEIADALEAEIRTIRHSCAELQRLAAELKRVDPARAAA